jgi:hypothetical protein
MNCEEEEQSPSSEANSHSASQEISRLSWNPKVHFTDHKNPLVTPILSQMHPVHILQSYFPKINSEIISHLRLGVTSGLFPSDFLTRIFYVFLLSAMPALRPHLILLDLTILIICKV